jgi:Fungal domain of unknown function (DUF1709).
MHLYTTASGISLLVMEALLVPMSLSATMKIRHFGRPHIVDVACFNEWAVDEQPSSVKSKKSATSVTAQRRPPYKIGKLELQLLFVPKPKGSKEDDMPKSMNACIREMRDAESVAARSWEGFLSQQGGDCPVSFTRSFSVVTVF